MTHLVRWFASSICHSYVTLAEGIGEGIGDAETMAFKTLMFGNHFFIGGAYPWLTRTRHRGLKGESHVFYFDFFWWSFEAQKTGRNWCPKMPVLCIELRLKSIRFIPNHPGVFCEPTSTKGHPKCRYALHFPHGFIGMIKIRYHPANLDLVLDLFILRAPLLAHCCSAAGESLRAMI